MLRNREVPFEDHVIAGCMTSMNMLVCLLVVPSMLLVGSPESFSDSHGDTTFLHRYHPCLTFFNSAMLVLIHLA